MAAASWSTSNALLKTRFRKLVDAYYKNFPLLGMIKKSPVVTGGRTINHTVLYSPGGGASSTFTSAQGGTTATYEVEFGLKWFTHYGLKQFDGLFLANMKSSEEAYITKMAELQKQCLDMVNHRLSTSLFGNGYGYVGYVSSITTATAAVATLSPKSDTQNFYVGMKVRASSSATSSAPASGQAVVAKINHQSGTLTFTVTSTIVATQYLYPAGDASSVFPGLAAWIPATAPSAAETIFGSSVDRRPDIEALAGCRLDASAYTSREEALIDAASEVWRIGGGKVTHFVMNPKQLAALIKELGAKVTYTRVSAQNEKGPIAGVGFDAVRVFGAGGPVECLADSHCPLNYCWGIDINEIKLLSAGGREIPSILEEDGNMILRLYNADTYELRVGAYVALAVDRPGNFIVVTMPTLT